MYVANAVALKTKSMQEYTSNGKAKQVPRTKKSQGRTD